MVAKTPEEREIYENRLKADRDARAQSALAKQGGVEEAELTGQARLVAVL